MHAHADPVPRHHPKWPRRCPKCSIPALGFRVVVPIGRRLDPDSGEMRTWAWSTTVMACERCHKAVLPSPEEGAPVTEEYLRALMRTDVYGLHTVNFVSVDLYQSMYCIPAEEPVQEGV